MTPGMLNCNETGVDVLEEIEAFEKEIFIPRNIQDRLNPLEDLSNIEFRDRYRFSKNIALF